MNTYSHSFSWLALAMKNRIHVAILSNKTIYKGIINGMAVEDGSGNNWLVTMNLCDGQTKTIFVKAE